MPNSPEHFNQADIHNFDFGAKTPIFILVSIVLHLKLKGNPRELSLTDQFKDLSK
jgi:hypothetical protein